MFLVLTRDQNSEVEPVSRLFGVAQFARQSSFSSKERERKSSLRLRQFDKVKSMITENLLIAKYDERICFPMTPVPQVHVSLDKLFGIAALVVEIRFCFGTI